MLLEAEPWARTSRKEVRGDVVRRPALAGVRTRVLVSFLALLVISTAVSLFVLREVLMSRIGDRVVAELSRELEPLRELESGDPETGEPWPGVGSLVEAFFERNTPPSNGLFAALVPGETPRILSSEASVTESRLPASVAALPVRTVPDSGTVETAAGEAVWVGVPLAGERGMIVAAALTAAERDQVEDAVRLAIGVSLVVLLLASLFIWLAAGRTVAPLLALSQAARAISETDLSRRIPVRGNDEIAELGRTFNGMLDRLEAAFAGQKEFLTDVSHELRTPITVIRGHLETVGQSEAERAEATAIIEDELARMSRYVDDLLLLTKAPRPDFLRPAPQDLDLFTHELFAKARSLAARDWQLERTGVGVVQADQQRLTQAMMNLVANAIHHTREGDRIALGSSFDGTHARLWVRDEGTGIDAPDRDRIFERYARGGGLSGHDGRGLGLGLSIVRAIAEAHGGWVELDSEPGLGSTFTIVLPVDG